MKEKKGITQRKQIFSCFPCGPSSRKKMRESTKMDKRRELNENMCHKTFSVNFLTSFSDPYNHVKGTLMQISKSPYMFVFI